MSFDKTFLQLTIADIECLVQNKVSEDKNLEFKQQILNNNDGKAKIKIRVFGAAASYSNPQFFNCSVIFSLFKIFS